jgi:hypothetical protein
MLSVIKLSAVILIVVMLSVVNKPIMLSIVMLNVVMLSVLNKPIMLSIVMVNVVMLSVVNKPIMLNIVMVNVDMVSVVAPLGDLRGEFIFSSLFESHPKREKCCFCQRNFKFWNQKRKFWFFKSFALMVKLTAHTD